MPSDPDRPAPIRVVVIDADERIRESLTRLLGIDDRLRIVGSAGGTDAALKLVAEVGPDIIVVDPRLPDMDGGRAFIERLRVTAPAVRVLVMSSATPPDEPDLSDFCDGYVRKTFRPSDLIAAIFAATAQATS